MWLSGLSRAERKTVSISSRATQNVNITLKNSSQRWLKGFESQQVVFHTDPNGGIPRKCHGNACLHLHASVSDEVT